MVSSPCSRTSLSVFGGSSFLPGATVGGSRSSSNRGLQSSSARDGSGALARRAELRTTRSTQARRGGRHGGSASPRAGVKRLSPPGLVVLRPRRGRRSDQASITLGVRCQRRWRAGYTRSSPPCRTTADGTPIVYLEVCARLPIRRLRFELVATRAHLGARAQSDAPRSTVSGPPDGRRFRKRWRDVCSASLGPDGIDEHHTRRRSHRRHRWPRGSRAQHESGRRLGDASHHHHARPSTPQRRLLLHLGERIGLVAAVESDLIGDLHHHSG